MNHPEPLNHCLGQQEAQRSGIGIMASAAQGFAGQCNAVGAPQTPTIRATVDIRCDQDFSAALAAVKRGHRITRLGWNGKGMHVELQRPDRHSKMSRPYLYMQTVDGALVPWVASQTDLLANDWAILPN